MYVLRCYRITPEKADRSGPSHGQAPATWTARSGDHLYAIGRFTDGREKLKDPDGKPANGLWCMHLPTGAVVGVQRPTPGPEMLAADGLILDQHYKMVWRAVPGAFELLSKPSTTIAADWAPAAIADGRYFARLDRFCMGIVCYDLRRAAK